MREEIILKTQMLPVKNIPFFGQNLCVLLLLKTIIQGGWKKRKEIIPLDGPEDQD